MSLPTDPTERKRLQLYTYQFNYFPDAFLAEVDVARAGNDQHNPGEPLHWARGKSTDQMNAAYNHITDYGLGQKKDSDGCWHLAKAIWRLKAQLQLDIEAERESNGLAGVAVGGSLTEKALGQANIQNEPSAPKAAPTVKNLSGKIEQPPLIVCGTCYKERCVCSGAPR